MTTLVTGICGFVGRHLARHLLDAGEHVFGTYLDLQDKSQAGPLAKHVGLLQGDVRNPRRMGVILRKTQPETIYHLAAQASLGLSFDKPVATIDVNVTGTAGLLEAVKRESPHTRILFPSSAEVYGRVRPRDVPLRETHPPAPQSPYGASKLAAEEICRQYARTYGLHIVIARGFNHSGPGQGRGYVIPDFASQIAQLEHARGKREIKVGNLNARRDLSDVRDIVKGYRLLCRRGKPGDIYNLSAGQAYRIRDLLESLVEMARVPVKVVVDPARKRPADVPILSGSSAKARRRTGWRVSIPIEQTLADTLEYWRAQRNER